MAKITVFSVCVKMRFEKALDSGQWGISRVDGCMEEKWSLWTLRSGLSWCRRVMHCRFLIQKFLNGGTENWFDGDAVISSIEEMVVASYKECKTISIKSAKLFGTMDHAKDDTLDDAS